MSSAAVVVGALRVKFNEDTGVDNSIHKTPKERKMKKKGKTDKNWN